ncbi:dihydrofolate reductase [Dysgonomonas sp. PFB1-18]|uniref:hypothetical protein n=1 Tax=unclassified Dysgonomonas TaxID=2630389 RepID=UPI0024731797|nr:MULTISPECIES: hypothetical protein [unclassified Dysgonomonas]MDH6310648.1 dihydrofolate reductase [Dysgonomonas sp. PF1-14]MDH6340499.1 dihydrofolate reductase [Dysgonomonas sp. PF1-16]MDH6382093.1 dihydrofolate reductase [Dysgonomonas sp. PFB1-18]MDH6399437.1 dihydrofolate reductase [Dysgonomonas sp. PF1-23]
MLHHSTSVLQPDGSLDWLTEFPSSQKIDYGYKDLLVSVDTVIIGGKTYRELLSMDVIWPYPTCSKIHLLFK